MELDKKYILMLDLNYNTINIPFIVFLRLEVPTNLGHKLHSTKSYW